MCKEIKRFDYITRDKSVYDIKDANRHKIDVSAFKIPSTELIPEGETRRECTIAHKSLYIIYIKGNSARMYLFSRPPAACLCKKL